MSNSQCRRASLSWTRRDLALVAAHHTFLVSELEDACRWTKARRSPKDLTKIQKSPANDMGISWSACDGRGGLPQVAE